MGIKECVGTSSGSRSDPRVAKRSSGLHNPPMPWAILLLTGAALFRCLRPWVGGPENFAPMAALALCGGLYLPRPWNWAGPLLSLLVSEVVLNLHYGMGILTGSTIAAAAAYLLIVALGDFLARRPTWGGWLAGSLVASVIFYLLTNTQAWWVLPGYEKSWTGWTQALTTGLPGYPPTWTFLRNSVISDLIFVAVFVVGVEWSAQRFSGRVRPLRPSFTFRSVC